MFIYVLHVYHIHLLHVLGYGIYICNMYVAENTIFVKIRNLQHAGVFRHFVCMYVWQ